ncbi:MAG: ribosomal L7Ae/L30e/S12e/Gadd45 family protein [Oscillospiraceae bacterium]|nr:ribosomal L7Ae/L30e/S12e/Gadd45 family protein [Oscillospiraceae bacterium]
MNKLLNLLTMCRRAGQLQMGFDAMKEALSGGKAKAVIIAADVSPKTEKEARFFADKYNVPAEKTDTSLDEILAALGKRAGLLTICDEGFAKKALSLCSDFENRYDT